MARPDAAGASCFCGACGQPLGDVPLAMLMAVVPGQMGRIVEAVAQHPGIGRAGIVEAIYADDPEGPPATAHNAVSVNLNRHNAQLEAIGWRVGGDGWKGYRLERIG